ncbi:MAG: hypothetical protein AAB336_02135 [Acidobacteriota bacterium]
MKLKFCLIILTILFFQLLISAQNPEPKTVTDFFYLLPEKHFAPFEDGNGKKQNLKDFRKSIIKIADNKNGFLRLESFQWEGWAEVAIFKKTNGKYIVGVIENGCGPVCGSDVFFYSYENKKWSDVTTQVLPKITETQFAEAYKRHKTTEEDETGIIYELPRVGKTIKVRTDGGKNIVFFELTWNGSKFILKNK